MVIVENIIPRNMIINLGCASVNNHIPRDDIFDYHHIREGNIYIVSHVWESVFSDNPKSPYAIHSMPPAGYLPTGLISLNGERLS